MGGIATVCRPQCHSGACARLRVRIRSRNSNAPRIIRNRLLILPATNLEGVVSVLAASTLGVREDHTGLRLAAVAARWRQ
jgi:hypothetical protein